MRLSLVILGWELVAIEFGNGAEEVEQPDIDGGYLTSAPISFVATHELPDEASGLTDRRPWDD